MSIMPYAFFCESILRSLVIRTKYSGSYVVFRDVDMYPSPNTFALFAFLIIFQNKCNNDFGVFIHSFQECMSLCGTKCYFLICMRYLIRQKTMLRHAALGVICFQIYVVIRCTGFSVDQLAYSSHLIVRCSGS